MLDLHEIGILIRYNTITQKKETHMRTFRKILSSRFAVVAIMGVFAMGSFTSCQREGCPGQITDAAPVEVVVEQGC